MFRKEVNTIFVELVHLTIFPPCDIKDLHSSVISSAKEQTWQQVIHTVYTICTCL